MLIFAVKCFVGGFFACLGMMSAVWFLAEIFSFQVNANVDASVEVSKEIKDET